MRWLRWRGAILILVAACSWPLEILAANVVGIVRPERVVAIMAAATVVGILILAALVGLRVNLESAENTTMITLLLVMHGGAILREFGTLLGLGVIVTLPGLTCWVSARMKGQLVLNALVWAGTVAIAVGPPVAYFNTIQEDRGPSLVKERAYFSVDFSSRPDIFLVVLDGYPGVIASEQDGLDIGIVDVATELRARGFEVPPSSWASYWITILSIPSLLEMDYPVTDEGRRGLKTREELEDIMSGDSAFVHTLQRGGYKTHMIESGWSGASCSVGFDECVPSPWIDEATYTILSNTVIWPVLSSSPGPWALGTLAGFDWIASRGPELSQSLQPDFVFMHVISPHAPYLLTEDCSVDVSYERAGLRFHIPDVSGEERSRYLVQQIDCLDRQMLRLADTIDSDDVLVFISDHGTDRHHQTDAELVNWDREATVERLNVFLAVRLPAGCSVGDEIVLPNVLRRVLACLSVSDLDPLPNRMWINPMAELESDYVEDLMSMRAESG